MKNLIILSAIFSTFLVSSCKSKSDQEQELLQAYITENNITTSPTTSGLYYIETLAGTGNYAENGDLVKVHYEGRFLDGEIFDSSIYGDPIEFKLGYGYVIPGWDEGIQYMKKGGKATLIIPSDLAYGTDGKSSIPGYSTLIFDVELIGIL